MDICCEKMIFAVLSGRDCAETVQDLNAHGFYATLLSTTGGFLRKKSVTLMIGLEAERLDEALSILKCHAGDGNHLFTHRLHRWLPDARKGSRRRNHGIHPEC